MSKGSGARWLAGGILYLVEFSELFVKCFMCFDQRSVRLLIPGTREGWKQGREGTGRGGKGRGGMGRERDGRGGKRREAEERGGKGSRVCRRATDCTHSD